MPDLVDDTGVPSDTPTTTAPQPGIEAILGGEEGRRSRPMWRIAAGVLVGLVVLAALAWGLRGGDGAGATSWVTGEVTRGDLKVTVTATGTVQPTNEVEISSELSGTLRKVLVDYNDRVRRGQVLAVLDTDKLAAQAAVSSATLASKRAKLLEAQATVRETESELLRIETLARKGTSSAQDLVTAQAAYQRALAGQASARADVQVAEADLLLKHTDLSKARIVSPIEGVVLKRNADPGQTVAASLQAPVLFTLAEDLSRMELQVDVDEADVGVTRVGQKATFTVDAYPGRTFPAVVRQLRYAPETTEGVVTYKAVLSIDNSQRLLRPGMTATAEITVNQVEGALLVPNEALRFEPPAPKDSGGILDSLLPGRRFRRLHANHTSRPTGKQVWTLDGEVPVAVPIETGPSDGARTVVRKGALEPGARVVVDVRVRK